MSEQFWQLNKATSDNAESGEKHTPVIAIEGQVKPKEEIKVHVDVGSDKHPNTNGHHFQWVELRGNDLFIARAEFSPEITKSKATFDLIVPNSPFTLTAIARCNLHGVWTSEPVEINP